MKERVKREWLQTAKGYGWFSAATGLPCAGLSLYLWTPAFILAWLYVILALPFALLSVTVMWGVTAYPLLLVLGFLSGRASADVTSIDPDGPGVVICPFGGAVERERPPPEAPGGT